MFTCMMGWLILVITLPSFQLVNCILYLWGGGMLGEVVERTQVNVGRYECVNIGYTSSSSATVIA